jgi:hypothetical protein
MSQLEKVQYTAKAHTADGRDGASRGDDGRKLGTPAASAPG